MSGQLWTKGELKKLEHISSQREPWLTDFELARRISGQFKRTEESIRWQLRQMRSDAIQTMPRILLLDIETLPIEGSVWGVWGQDIHPAQIKKDWSIVCWSAKWIFDSKVAGESVTPDEAITRQDKSVLGGLWTMMNEATHIITHNGEDFDFKKINTRLLVNGFPPPMYYRSIDTLKILRSKFAFTYNKLDEVNKTLGLSRKVETSFKWWDECSAGNKKYLDLMLKYNKQDVHVLEELYLTLRPWIDNAPNMNLYDLRGAEVCKCGSVNLHWNGVYTSPKNTYRAFRCEDCGAIGRSARKQDKIASTKIGG